VVPFAVQIDAMHVQDATPPLVVHVWCAAQATAVSHWPAAEHVWTPLPEHCVEPGVHATHAPFKHTGVSPTHDDEVVS
jgi:hypothetical protein